MGNKKYIGYPKFNIKKLDLGKRMSEHLGPKENKRYQDPDAVSGSIFSQPLLGRRS